MITEIQSESQFEDITKTGKVLVEFYSKTCGPCKMLSFVLKDVDKVVEDVHIITVDFDEFSELKERLKVKGFPTMIMMRDGDETQRLQGLKQKTAIIGMINDA